MWSFAVPLLLAKLFTSLLPSSLFSTVSQIACVIFGGYMGSWIDRYNRLKLQQTALIVQNLSVVSSFVLLITLQYKYKASSRIDPLWNDGIFLFLFFGAIFLGAVAAVASMITSISISKEWIVIIQKAHPYMALSNVNATFRRIDLSCKLIAPMAFALVLQFAGLTASLIIVTCWNAISLIPESILTQMLYRHVPELAIPKSAENLRSKSPNPLAQIIAGWRSYFSQPIFMSSLTYVLLYFTVLSPGGVMTAYLDFQEMPETLNALFNGLGAVVGLLATFATPYLISKFKLRKTGLFALWSQLAMLIFTIIPFLTSTTKDTFILPLAIAVSRFGLWTFDLVEVELMQTYVADVERATVSGVEYSMTNLISVLAFGMGIVVPDPKHFIYLVIASISVVAIANLIYSIWFFSPPRGVLHIEAERARGNETATAPSELDLPASLDSNDTESTSSPPENDK
jgi:iron-regulated transporter 1